MTVRVKIQTEKNVVTNKDASASHQGRHTRHGSIDDRIRAPRESTQRDVLRVLLSEYTATLYQFV